MVRGGYERDIPFFSAGWRVAYRTLYLARKEPPSPHVRDNSSS